MERYGKKASFRIAEIITDGKPSQIWHLLKQVGIDEIVGTLPLSRTDWRNEETDDPWDYAPLANFKRTLGEYGLKLSAIEDNPPMEKIKYGIDGRDEELENIIKMIENFGRLGIGVWCYNWMAGYGWARTRIGIKDRGGSTVTGFSFEDVKEYPPPKMGKIDSHDLWKNLEWFLGNVVPVAEENNVKLAMHPDDPPVPSIRGTDRIMNTVESFDRLVDTVKSDSNTIALCQGNFTLMTDDLPSVIRHFVRKKKVSFVHFRDVSGNPYDFRETFINAGKTDMVECMRSYIESGFDGIMRSDHTPTLYGDTADIPGYSILGRLHAIGYIQGLMDSLSEKMENRK